MEDPAEHQKRLSRVSDIQAVVEESARAKEDALVAQMQRRPANRRERRAAKAIGRSIRVTQARRG